MTKLEIDGIRKRSKSPDRGPWQTDYNEMAKKTVVHRASKLWPLDAKFKEAIEVQEVKEATIDLPALPAAEDDSKVIELDEVPMEAPTPLASKPVAAPEPADEETPGQLAKRLVIEAGVPFDLFTADLNARNIATEAVTSAWPDYEAVTEQVWSTLGLQQKTLANLVKKFGTKK
jgi:hypothetical protein